MADQKQNKEDIMRTLLLTLLVAFTATAINADDTKVLKKDKRSIQAKINFSDASKKLNGNEELAKLKASIEAANEAYTAKKRELIIKADPSMAELFAKLDEINAKLAETK